MDVSYTLFDSSRVGETTLLDVYPFYPVYPGEQNLRLVEDRHELSFVLGKRTCGFVGVECGLPITGVSSAQASGKPGNVGGNALDSHRAEIDDAGYLIANEEDVVVPDIAEAGLKGNRDCGCCFESSLKGYQSGADERQDFGRSFFRRRIGD